VERRARSAPDAEATALNVPIVQMFSNDERLSRLGIWEPSSDEAVGAW
jgi:hypothetical protein